MAIKLNMWRPKPAPFRKYKKELYQKIIDICNFIYQIGESEDLRLPSREIPINQIILKEMQLKIAYLRKCMMRYRQLTGYGRGITAVQVGIPERFSVIYMPIRNVNKLSCMAGEPEIKKEDLLIIINPKITKKSKRLLRYPEVCMSANPIIAPVVRPAWIEFEYYNETGIKKYWKTKDNTKQGRMYNRVFQHEIDHMDGIINIDKVSSKELIFESDPKFYERAKFEKI